MSATISLCSNEKNFTKFPCRLIRRHYKKDSRFVLDLYTLTYDSHESLDSLGDLSERRFDVASIQNIAKDNKTVLKNGNNVRHGNAKNSFAPRYRRPSLLSRLQDGNNLQLCFLNQQSSEIEDNQLENGALSLPIFQSKYILNDEKNTEYQRELENSSVSSEFNYEKTKHDTNNNTNRNFHELQNEVCISLKKIYGEANRRMEFNNRRRSDSPISCTIKASLKKVGVNSGENTLGRRRMSRQMLTKMKPCQLQTIIDDLHAHVEFLNEQLMKTLVERDELHMSRDSLLVDIEDITAYLNAKQGYQKSNFINYVPDANYSSNYIPDAAISSICTRKVVSPGTRYNRLNSYI